MGQQAAMIKSQQRHLVDDFDEAYSLFYSFPTLNLLSLTLKVKKSPELPSLFYCKHFKGTKPISINIAC